MTAANARRSRCCCRVLPATFTLLIGLCMPAMGQSWRAPLEPDYQTINSGRCEVGVCTDFDFGDRVFRMYADGRPHTLHLIPPGTCTCKRVQSADRNFNYGLNFGIKDAGGHSTPNISIVHMRPPARSPQLCSSGRTTYEAFKGIEGTLEATESLVWKEDKFETYSVFQTKQAFGRARDFRKYYLVPKSPTYVTVGGRSELVAFSTPLIIRVDGQSFERDGGGFSSSFQYSETSCFFQSFNARLTPSNRWPEELQKTINFLDTRLLPKSKAE